jgi:hypothetical protein
MPAPLLWLGVGALALLAHTKYTNDKILDESVDILPGDSNTPITPQDGAVVTCGVYGMFEHTGIWLDGNIIELKGNGLIRGISPARFLDERSGNKIYIACDVHDNALIDSEAINRATSKLFSYSEYDVIKNNCHKFVWYCLSGQEKSLTRFSGLNQLIAEKFKTSIHWNPAVIDRNQ